MEEWPEQKTLLLLRFLDKKHQRFTEAFSSPSNKQFKAEKLIFILDFNGFSTTNSAFYCSTWNSTAMLCQAFTKPV